MNLNSAGTLSRIIRERRCIRSFSSRTLDRETVEQVLEAAKWAPSAGNLQPWVFIVVQKLETKRKLAWAALGQDFIAEAPFLVVVCADTLRSSSRYGRRGAELYCIQDTAAAIQNMLLTAHSLGLAACWVGAFNEDEARSVLGLPAEMRPLALIPIGFSESHPRAPSRRSLSDVVYWPE